MTSLQANSGSATPPGLGGRLVLTCFFLVFFAMGSVFVGLVGREALAGLRTWSWQKTECEIVRSGIRETDQRGRNTGNFSPEAEYRYSVAGKWFNSDHLTLKATSYSDYGKAERLVDKYQPGARSTCYVNPADPSQAVLQRGSLAFPFLILFPMIFVGIGAIGIYSAWRPSSLRPAENRPISDRARGFSAQRFAMFFFGLFVVGGLAMSYALSIRPLSQMMSARQWPAVPCTIISSTVKSHRADHGSTYSVNILYSYIFNDHPYKANRYDFMGGSSSGFNGKQAIVARYAPGSAAVCYVDPSEPTQAVLERGFTPMMWIGLLPLVFVLLGLVGIVSTVRKTRAQGPGAAGFERPFATGSTAGTTYNQTPGSLSSASLALQAGSSPWTKCLVTIFIALFWNGIISVFLVQLVKSWRSGFFEWFLALFLTPFVLVGLGLLVAIGYFFLALFNPRPRLTITPGAPRLGDNLRVEWEVSGRVESLQNLRIRLQGREEATYTRGTTTSTDRNVFAQLDIAAVTTPQEMRSGSGQVIVPATLMHSFSAKHNKVIWSIRLEGEIPRWPDMAQEFSLTVLPAVPKPSQEL